MSNNPEIAEMQKQRRARRESLANLSFEEKIEIVERLRELGNNRDLMNSRRREAEPSGDEVAPRS
ncbi:MAG: hypothetical protein M3430_19580 [Acidobacteriota bacterium]|nr:hypothetical protein [Acidobacteriota bacterium]